eukprot:6874993-Alexandrium_andersonii.AAC.1
MAAIPGGLVLTPYWRAVQFIPASCGIAVYSGAESMALSFLRCHRVERVATHFHAAFRAA